METAGRPVCRSVGLSEWRVARYGKPRSVACRPAVTCLCTGERLVQRGCLVRFGGGEGNVSAKNLELAIKVLPSVEKKNDRKAQKSLW